MAESFVEKRKRELSESAGTSGGVSSAESFVERRKRELREPSTANNQSNVKTSFKTSELLSSIGVDSTKFGKTDVKAPVKTITKPVSQPPTGIKTPMITGLHAATGDKQALKDYKKMTGFEFAPLTDAPDTRTQYEKEQENINNSNWPGVVKGIATAGNRLTRGNVVGQFLSKATTVPGVSVEKTDSTGNKIADKAGKLLGDYVSPLLVPTGAPLGSGTMAAPYEAAGKLLNTGAGQKVVNTFGAGLSKVPLISKGAGQGLARVGLTEGLAGTIQNPAQALVNDPNRSTKELATDAAIGGAAGLGLGMGGYAVGKGISKGIGKLTGKNKVAESVVADAIAPKTVSRVSSEPIVTPQKKLQQEIIEPIAGNPYSTETADIPDFLKPANRRTMTPEITPTIEPIIPSPLKPTSGLRGNFQNQLKNGNFSEELQSSIKATDQKYDVAHNVDSVAKANAKIVDLTNASSDFKGNESGGADHVATGYRLLQELDRVGQHGQALEIAEKLAADLTKAGQTVQAASILARLSPEGQLLRLTRLAEKNGTKVSVEDSVKFKELAAKVQENTGAGAKANEFNEILNRLEKGDNVTVKDIKTLSDFLTGAEKKIQPRVKTVMDKLPEELKDVRKRDRVVSFLDDAETAALARIKARKNQLNSLPLGEWADHAIVVSAQIAKGGIKAADHVEKIVTMFGEEIRPYATEVFQKAQDIVGGISRNAAEGNLAKANAAFRKITGQAETEKEIVKETAAHVRKLINDAKQGELTREGVQKLRDYADEIADMLAEKKPGKLPTQEEKFLQTVKSLAKKIAQVESSTLPADQANREVSSLLRQVAKLSEEGTIKIIQEPIDTKVLSDIAHDVLEKTRPTPKPSTLQEKIVEKYIKQNKSVSTKDIETLRKLAKDITKLSGDQKIDADISMQKILNSYEKSSLWDKTLAIRYMAMLLNTGTQAVNALSGPIMSTTGTVADVFGTMVDIAMNKTLKTPRTTTLYGTNPLRFMSHWFKNLKIGGKAGAQGVNPGGIQGTNEIRGLAFKSLKNPFGLAERALGAVAKGPDFATYKTVFDSEIARQGFLEAKNKGLKGKDIKSYIEKFVNDPPEEAILQADRIGKNTTFQRSDTSGGKAANFLNNSPSFIKPVTTAIFPFVRTPINIASTAVTISPGGIFKGLFQLTSKSKATQREALRTLSLGLTGTGLSAMGYYLSQLGIITGANDSGDKNVDNIREQAGKGKYRFNTSALGRYMSAMIDGKGPEAAEHAAKYQEGDKQFDYNKLQPLAFPLAIGAGVSDKKAEGLSGKAYGAGMDAYGSLFGMSTLKGVQDIFQPSYGGTQGEKALGVPTRLAESFFKSFSPSALAQEARRQDPISRKTSYNDGLFKDVGDYFNSRIPGQSQSLPANKTTLGQNKLNAPGIKGQYLNPYKSDVAPYNKAARIISDLIDRTGDTTLAPKAPAKNVSGKNDNDESVTIAIPAKRYAKLQEDVGNEIITRILDLPRSADEELGTAIHDIYEEVRKEKMDEVKEELGIWVD